MSLADEYVTARRSEDLARLRRAIALRALVESGLSQRQIAEKLGISQPAVSQQLRSSPDLRSYPAREVLEAAAPVLKELAREHGFSRLAVFGSIARGKSGPRSDIDLIVRAPRGTSSLGMVKFQRLVEAVLNRKVDLIEYGGLKQGIDDDIRREAVLL